MKPITAVFLLFCLILCDNAYGDNINGGGNTNIPKKKTPKKAPEPLIDVHELISEMVRKEEELVTVTKQKSKYKMVATVLASLLGIVSGVLAGGAGLVLHNTSKGRPPFSFGGGDSNTSASPTESPEPEKEK
ncbi:circumsporozoite-related antigen [Plasmodium gonderi]|uniref:Circumsporozoite-related antigen n=1 Tax=Plasmodium gonderi TaxID=77519 RepID=A0A1Y1JLQ1_PLAGO|nr:circumsporozoite-related antigen [Plasmodium gonderi]GAW80984.1 circumsporozoite-related antigen [Plasmodium gonderi]